MNKESKLLIIFTVFACICAITGGTFAYWAWNSSNVQNTLINFTVPQGFSCSADGGGNITSTTIKLAPAVCSSSPDTTKLIKRTVTVNRTISQPGDTVYLDLWLKVNSIDSGLNGTHNFKYALTTSASTCTSGTVVASGDFYGATAGTKKTLIDDKAYTTSGSETYYLWIWLDSAETGAMNQAFFLELGGSCTEQPPSS